MEQVQLSWAGAHRGGRLFVDLDPQGVEERLLAEVDRQFTNGGPLVVSARTYQGEVGRGAFRYRVRPWLGGRNNAAPYLVGTYRPRERGTVLEFEVQPPWLFLTFLPVLALAPVIAAGVFVVAVLNMSGGEPAAAVLAAAAATVPVLCLWGVLLWVFFVIRRDAGRLVRGLHWMFEDVKIEAVLPARPRD